MNGYIPYEQVVKQIKGIMPGDTIYVVSDILALSLAARENGERFDIQKFIDSILEQVGENGNVLIPTFNWGFCKGETFDIRKTVSKTGALGNAAMKRADFKRTKHPIYSFMVWGKDREYLANMDYQEGFGPGSVFEYMYEKKAKALVIGLPTLSGLTFIHYVEQCVGVPYRYSKPFTANYIDENGNEGVRTYCMYVRDLDKNPKHINSFRPLGEILEKLNVSQTYFCNDVEFHVVDLESMYEVTKIDITLNDSRNMYVYNK